MKENTKFIFDMDGTLYNFERSSGQVFGSSRLGQDVGSNVLKFFVDRFGLDPETADAERARIATKFNGEISIGVEAEFGINRSDYFAATWDLQPENYMKPNPELRGQLDEIRGRIALLTLAPKIWALRVLAFLDVEDSFEGKIFTGDPDERKPNPAVFRTVASALAASPTEVFSIGDQEHSDIAPAKSIEMKTLLIGSSQDTVADYQASDIKSAIGLLKKEGFI